MPLGLFGFPGGSAGKESACNVGDLGSIPRLGRSPAEEKGYPLQYSGLESSMDCSPRGCKESNTTERLLLRPAVPIESIMYEQFLEQCLARNKRLSPHLDSRILYLPVIPESS